MRAGTVDSREGASGRAQQAATEATMTHALRAACLAGLAGACGGTDAPTMMAMPDGGGAPEFGDAAQIAVPDAARYCDDGQSQVCACSEGGIGARRCVDGVYAACVGCSAAPGPGDGARCVPGTYVGTWTLDYRAGPNGFDGLFGPFEATHSEGSWSFTLARDGNGEFFTVGNGCLRMLDPTTGAEPVGVDVQGTLTKPFRAQIIGQVDCATGILDGELRGYYTATNYASLGTAVNTYYVKGPIRGSFDATEKQFVAGTWDPREPPVLLGDPPGGQGTWSAAWTTSDDSASDAKDCLDGVPFMDALFP
jgi:hypothetical protein